MDKTVAQFEVSSPEELRAALAGFSPDGREHFAAVRVFGPQVLTRHFQLPVMPQQDLVAGLKLEAGEIFSVSAKEIELVYGVVSRTDGHIGGVYAAIPRRLVLEYLACFKKSSMALVSLMSSACGLTADFVKDHPSPGRDYFLVNFLRPHTAGIVAFIDAEPVLFREFLENSDADIEEKIVDSIRYCCSRSAAKKLDEVFFSGDLTGKEALMGRLKALASPDAARQLEATSFPFRPTDFAKLNLLQQYVLGREERTALTSGLTAAVTACLVLVVFLAARAVQGAVLLRDTRASFSAEKYQQFQDLQAKLRYYSHEK